jgi:hypothetical protein
VSNLSCPPTLATELLCCTAAPLRMAAALLCAPDLAIAAARMSSPKPHLWQVSAADSKCNACRAGLLVGALLRLLPRLAQQPTPQRVAAGSQATCPHRPANKGRLPCCGYACCTKFVSPCLHCLQSKLPGSENDHANENLHEAACWMSHDIPCWVLKQLSSKRSTNLHSFKVSCASHDAALCLNQHTNVTTQMAYNGTTQLSQLDSQQRQLSQQRICTTAPSAGARQLRKLCAESMLELHATPRSCYGNRASCAIDSCRLSVNDSVMLISPILDCCTGRKQLHGRHFLAPSPLHVTRS